MPMLHCGKGMSWCFESDAMGLVGRLVSQTLRVFQVGGEGQSQQRDFGGVVVSCCLITAA